LNLPIKIVLLTSQTLYDCCAQNLFYAEVMHWLFQIYPSATKKKKKKKIKAWITNYKSNLRNAIFKYTTISEGGNHMLLVIKMTTKKA